MSEETLVRALAALVDGDTATARDLADRAAADDGSPLARALADHLDDTAGTSVYDQPAAFEAFIRGGGNVALYRAVSGALGELYDRHGVDRLLDVGCGDGTALLPALRSARHVPAAVDLLEPSPALLAACVRQLERARLPTAVTSWAGTAQDFAADLPDGRAWTLAQSTFALQSLPEDERSAVLAALRPRVEHLAVVEFDVPDVPRGSAEHLRSLVRRYQQGLGEYTADRDLVARGFLMPVLTGQLAPPHPGAERTNWEQPARAWQEQVVDAGYTEVTVRPLHEYWSSPAFLLTAHGGGTARGAPR